MGLASGHLAALVSKKGQGNALGVIATVEAFVMMKKTLTLLSLVGLVAASPGTLLPAQQGQSEAARRAKGLITVADSTLLRYATSYVFDWGEGVLMYGLMRAYSISNNTSYLEYVRKWADFHYEKGIPRVLDQGYPTSRRKFCGHWIPGMAVLLLYEETGDEKYLKTALHIGDYILNTATRTHGGALNIWEDQRQLWVDAMAMFCPILSRLSHVTDEARYVDEAARQIVLYAERLQDPEGGLFYHLWDETTGHRNPDFWGRGNGWAMLALVDTLEHLSESHPLRNRIEVIFRSQVAALLRHQDASGMWRTVVDREEAYPESSGSSMIAYGIAKGVRLGILEKTKLSNAQRCWEELLRRIDSEGKLLGTSDQTAPRDFAYYQSVFTGTFPWGTGAFLLLGYELAQLGVSVQN